MQNEAEPLTNQLGPPAPELAEPDVRWLFGLLNGFCNFQVVVAGCETDLFTFLAAHGPSDFDAVARHLEMPTQSARILLLGACDAGLVTRDPETRRYANAPIASVFVRTDPTNIIDYVMFSHEIVYKGMYHLTESLRRGTNVGLQEIPGDGPTLYERLGQHPKLERLFHQMMGSAVLRANVVHSEADVLGQITHLLDVGGATGTNATLLTEQYPTLKVTIFDLPSVVAKADARLASAGLAGRVRTVAGNLFHDDLPRDLGVDAILFSHVAELYGPARIRDFIHKAFEALPSGGHLLFWSVVSNDLETAGPVAVRGSLYYHAIATGEGMAYPIPDLERWFAEGGFEVVEVVELPTDHALVVGRKP